MIKQQLIHSDYQPLANEIERYFAQSSTILQDDRNTIKEVVFNNETLVVKSYKRLGWFRGLIYTYWKKSKAWRAYEYGLKIAKFTPKVVARIENFEPLLGIIKDRYGGYVCRYYTKRYFGQAHWLANRQRYYC
ncbi:hypothetical protein THERMOT_489 [Bathymodiolus thermophilus thioautotrophic gill symbiont]|nr:hypothetical protein THERMOT_489 [Bathymodiolus thermophilus thioautotrophic gill symbiont]